MKLLKMAAVAAGVLAAASSEPWRSSPCKKLGKPEGKVDIVAWPGYIERGATDKNFDWVTDFEKKTGCKVNVKTAGTSDEMVALMNEGGFDLVTASGDASMRLIRGKKVQPINVALIPSYKTVDPRLQKAPWHYVNNTHYGVPYQWGWNVLMYNTKVFRDKKPTSWTMVFEEQTLPDGKSNKGRVQAFDGPIYIADAALYLMKTKPDARHQGSVRAERGAVQGGARRCCAGSASWWASTGTTPSCRSTTSPTRAWSPRAPGSSRPTSSGPRSRPIATVVPEEGATGWADTTMMHAEAKHPNCAYMWMEHSLNPKLQGDLAAWFGSVPVVLDGLQGQHAAGDEGCARQGFDCFDKIAFWRTPTAQVRDAGRPVRAVPQVGVATTSRSSAAAEPAAGASAAAAAARSRSHQALPMTHAVVSRTCVSVRRQAGATAVDGVDLDIAAASSSRCSGPRARARPPACA